MIGVTNEGAGSSTVFDRPLHSNLERHRDKVEQLYTRENRNLKDVMAILLEEDGCNAT